MRQIAKLLAVLTIVAVIPTVGDAGPRHGFGFRGGRFERFYRQWPVAPPRREPWVAPDPWRVPQDAVRTGVRGGQLAPLGVVINNLQRRAPGRQLDTAVEFEDGRPVYRVRWITNQGRRIDYVIDAASGRYIGER